MMGQPQTSPAIVQQKENVTACFPFLTFTVLHVVIFSAEVCGLLVKDLQKLPKKSKPFDHKFKFVTHIGISNISGKF